MFGMLHAARLLSERGRPSKRSRRNPGGCANRPNSPTQACGTTADMIRMRALPAPQAPIIHLSQSKGTCLTLSGCHSPSAPLPFGGDLVRPVTTMELALVDGA
eukprot:4502979-Pyramimonas_sp.AAC.1